MGVGKPGIEGAQRACSVTDRLATGPVEHSCSCWALIARSTQAAGTSSDERFKPGGFLRALGTSQANATQTESQRHRRRGLCST